jgi:hypothetical protein
MPQVSMPPRRSCFGDALDAHLVRDHRFNATTAFLLPPTGITQVVMGLSFNATTAFLLRKTPGVWTGCFSGFNATTAFLLRLKRLRSRPFPGTFQCHHGVPASSKDWKLPISGKAGFNATTAFLLPEGDSPCPTSHAEFQCHHGVPASKGRIEMYFGYKHVSMPPRRSCFSFGIWPRPWVRRGFNATTAFLLRVMQRTLLQHGWCFNATTAFLLPALCSTKDWTLLAVSMPPRRSCFSPARAFSPSSLSWFQCHHGVPASLLYHRVVDSCQVRGGTSKGMGIVGFEHRSVSTAPLSPPRPSHHRRSAEAFSEPSIICPFRSLEG